MFLDKEYNRGSKPNTFAVWTSAQERGHSTGNVLFRSASFYDAAIVLRFLNGGQMNETQMAHFDRIAQESSTDTDHSAE